MQAVIQTSRRLDSFLHEVAQNFELFSNIQDQNQQPVAVDVLFQGLSNGTTLMQIQSGRMVPLSLQ
jgi:hypothetical protein